jgi:hypothetical protein
MGKSFQHYNPNSKIPTYTPEKSPFTDYEPFFEACKKYKTGKPDKKGNPTQELIPISAVSPIKNMLPTIIQDDLHQNTAFDLINTSYKYTYDVLKKNLEHAKKSLACVDSIFQKKMSELNPDCQDAFEEVANSAIANSNTRAELAIAFTEEPHLEADMEYASDTKTPAEFFTINKYMRMPLNTSKAESYTKLTDLEIKNINENWLPLIKNADQESQKDIPFWVYHDVTALGKKLKMIYPIRKKALLNFNLNLAKYPLIQYIKSDDPGREEFNFAYQKVVKNIEKEIALIKERQNRLILDPKKEVKSEDLFILSYQTTEGILVANPQYCSIAQSLNEYQVKKGYYVGGASLVAFLGASRLRVPAPVIFAAGTAVSGLATYESYKTYKAALQAHLSSPTYEDQVFRKVKVDAAKTDLIISGGMAAAFGLPTGVMMKDVLKTAKSISKIQISQYFKIKK